MNDNGQGDVLKGANDDISEASAPAVLIRPSGSLVALHCMCDAALMKKTRSAVQPYLLSEESCARTRSDHVFWVVGINCAAVKALLDGAEVRSETRN